MYLFEPGLLLGVIPTKQIGDGLISLIYNFPLCLRCHINEYSGLAFWRLNKEVHG